MEEFDLKKYLEENYEDPFRLHSLNLNHQLVKVLKATGFDVSYSHATGPYVYDNQGNKYYDFLAGFGVFALGRNHPTIKKALIDAINLDLPNLVQFEASELAGLLAKELLLKSPSNLSKVFFTNSGTESIEGAIKFARKATGREKILYFDHAFHGLSTGSLSLNGSDVFRQGFGKLLYGTQGVQLNSIEKIKSEISKANVAAVFIELIQGKGVHIADDSFVHELSALCKTYRTLLVVDEVQTGLGRTGKFYALDYYGIEPDIITVSKALSGGFIPVGAILTTPEIYSKVFSSMDKAAIHSSTFGQNQLAMVAGLATLKTIEEEDIIANANSIGTYLLEGLSALKDKYELLKDVRGRGLMIGIEFGEPSSLSLRSKFRFLETARKGLFSQLIVCPLFTRHRIITQVAGDKVNIIKLIPPLTITKDDADYFINSFSDVMDDAHKGNSLIYSFGKTLIKSALSNR